MINGSLACVGLGITLGAHITPIARSHIDASDVCFLAASDSIVEIWVNDMHSDVRSLQDLYQPGKSRKETYREMIDVVMTQVRLGNKVCGIFYGHPGVFAYVPHQLIRQALKEGYRAVMEPGISAEDCLIADLGIDPGKYGCQQYEASQFMFYKRKIDPSAYLILWQIGVVGDLNYGFEVTSGEHRKLLLSLLYSDYPKNHKVIIYEASTLATKSIRNETIELAELEHTILHDYTTLVIPPSQTMTPNLELIEKAKLIRI